MAVREQRQQFLYLFMLGLAMGVLVLTWGVYPFEVAFRPLMVVDIIPLAMNIGVLYLMNRKEYRSSVTSWLTMALVFLQIWALAELFQHISITVDSFYFWVQVEDFGSIFVPMLFYLFVYQYTENAMVSVRRFTALFLGSIIFLFIDTQLFVFHLGQEAVRWTKYGFSESFTPYFAFLVIWFVGLLLAALYRLWQFQREESNALRKQQIRLIAFAVAIPVLAGAITDGILPILGYDLFELAMVLTSVMSAIIAYAIFKYKLFAIEPEIISQHMFRAIPDAVLLTDATGRIQEYNAVAEQFFVANKATLLGVSVKNLLPFIPWDDEFYINPVMPGTREYTGEVRRTGTDKLLYARVIVSKVHRQIGATLGYILVIADITDMKVQSDQLETRLKEIEKINDLLIGRELKMKEMKDEIAHYKKALQTHEAQ